jgi:hypothetical protein
LFDWYNNEHYHSGLALLTPATVHYGETAAVLAQRREILATAYAQHPERFVRRAPQPAEPPTPVWINPPTPAGGSRDLQYCTLVSVSNLLTGSGLGLQLALVVSCPRIDSIRRSRYPHPPF